MILAVVGSRDYPDLDAVRRFVSSLPPETVIVTGGARGVDRVAEAAARECGMRVIVYRAEWKAHGRAAGIIRNRLIVDVAEAVVAFWDGRSPGTKHTIDYARQLGKTLLIFGPTGRPKEQSALEQGALDEEGIPDEGRAG